jgi:hypothetical protein
LSSHLPCLAGEPNDFRLQLRQSLVRALQGAQPAPRLLRELQNLADRVAILPFQPRDKGQTLLDLVESDWVGLDTIQVVRQLPGDVLKLVCCCLQRRSRLLKASVQTGELLKAARGLARRIGGGKSLRRLAGQQRVGRLHSLGEFFGVRQPGAC